MVYHLFVTSLLQQELPLFELKKIGKLIGCRVDDGECNEVINTVAALRFKTKKTIIYFIHTLPSICSTLLSTHPHVTPSPLFIIVSLGNKAVIKFAKKTLPCPT